MSETNRVSPLFWVVGILFLLWNAFGCYMYYLDKTLSDAKYAEAYGEPLAALRDAYPAWATAAYAIAVFGGLLAAILFLMRKKLAFPLFVLSLIAAIISFSWGFMTPEFKAAAGSSHWVMPAIVVGLGIFEVFVSRMKVNKGILT